MSNVSFEKIRGAPKADLHVHLEGTVSPELMYALTQRNYVDIPFESPQAVAAIVEAEPFASRVIPRRLGGPERDNPPSRFVRAFERARKLGWRTAARAGEEDPADYVARANGAFCDATWKGAMQQSLGDYWYA